MFFIGLSLLFWKVFLYSSDEGIKVGQTIDILFLQKHFDRCLLFQDNRVLEALVIFFLEFVPVQKLHGIAYGGAERFPCINFSEWPVGQFAETATVGFGAQDLVSQVDETADRVAVGVVDKDKCHYFGLYGCRSFVHIPATK